MLGCFLSLFSRPIFFATAILTDKPILLAFCRWTLCEFVSDLDIRGEGPIRGSLVLRDSSYVNTMQIFRKVLEVLRSKVAAAFCWVHLSVRGAGRGRIRLRNYNAFLRIAYIIYLEYNTQYLIV